MIGYLLAERRAVPAPADPAGTRRGNAILRAEDPCREADDQVE